MALKALTMPKWGIEMKEGTVAEWLTPEGGAFAKGELLVLIETDKITNEVEAPFDAKLARIVAPKGEVKPVGALLAVFADADEDAAAIDAFVGSFAAADTRTASAAGKAPAPAPAAARPAAPSAIPADANISPQARALAEAENVDLSAVKGSGREGRITYQDVAQAAQPPATPTLRGPLTLEANAVETLYASPLARRIAAQNGIDLTGVVGGGPRGRIVKADVLALLPQARQPTVAGAAPIDNTPEILPMSAIRKTIARRLTEAKQTIPHFYLGMEASMDALLALRPTANMVLGVKASLNDYIIRATALALMEVPDVNIQVHGSDVHRFPSADIAVAIASEKGLVTPVVRGVERLRVDAISAAVKTLISKAQRGKLGHEDLEGGTFTVSNLGMYGVDKFDAIINPPQGAILAVASLREVFAKGEDGQGRFEQRMAFSLSCDHRAIDGATGARFLAALKAILETPERLFS